MVDFHSHVLPGIDDGSQSVEESVQLLKTSARQRVTYIAATPHFYATRTTPEQFLLRREAAAEQLRAVWQPRFPHMALGAEVYYFEGVSRMEQLDLLKLEDTDLLLLEMPFSTWTGRMVSEILEIQKRADTTVVLAHIERYLSFQKSDVWHMLRDNGVLMQCNASFFLNWKTKRKALRMLRRGEIDFLGSDCHNMDTRPPRLREAVEVIDKSLGSQGRQILARQWNRLPVGSVEV